MKIRIILTVLVIVFAGWFSRAVGQPISTVARNTSAVATLNGGDVAYTTQATVDATLSLNWLAFGTFLALSGIWYGPVIRAFNESAPTA